MSIPPFAVVSSAIVGDRRLSLADLRIYIAISAHANRKTGAAWPSRRTLAKLTGYELAHVTRATGRLVQFGWLVRSLEGGVWRYRMARNFPGAHSRLEGRTDDRQLVLDFDNRPVCHVGGGTNPDIGGGTNPDIGGGTNPDIGGGGKMDGKGRRTGWSRAVARAEQIIEQRKEEQPPPPTPSGGVGNGVGGVLESGCGGGETLIYPQAIPRPMREGIGAMMERVPEGLRQPLLDELAGGLEAGHLQRPLMWFRKLVEEAVAGRFVPDLGRNVAFKRLPPQDQPPPCAPPRPPAPTREEIRISLSNLDKTAPAMAAVFRRMAPLLNC